MTGAGHHSEAEKSLSHARKADLGSALEHHHLAVAQVHATLALAAEGAAAQLEQIRAVLDGFSWEFSDRQLALEAIDRIVRGDGK